MTQQQTERDDALIAEARKNIEKICPALKDDTRTIAAEVLRLARENWTPPAKADWYLQVWKEAKAAYIYPNRTEHESDQAAAAVLRRHFAPPSEVVEAARFYDAPGSRAGNILARFILSLQDGAPITGQPLALITDEQIKQITNRFLGWKLPEDFHPDDGISFEPEFNKEWNAAQGKPPQRRTPTGTNLFSYTQAEAVVRFILADFILKGDV